MIICEENAYCSILETNGKINNGRLTITGYMLDSEISVNYLIDNFNLTEVFEFQESGLMIVYSTEVAIPTIIGSYHFRGDSLNVLIVEAEIH